MVHEAARLHMVSIEYKDDSAPSEERLLWELEPQRSQLEANALPDVFDPAGVNPLAMKEPASNAALSIGLRTTARTKACASILRA